MKNIKKNEGRRIFPSLEKKFNSIPEGMKLNFKNITIFALQAGEDEAIKEIDLKISQFLKNKELKSNPIKWLEQQLYDYVAEFENGSAATFWHFVKEARNVLGETPKLEACEEYLTDVTNG